MSTPHCVVGIINIITALILTLMFLATLCKLYENKDKLKRLNRYSILFTLCSILFHFILGLLDIPLFYFYEISHDGNISNIFYKIWYAVHCICRLSIYLVYIYRLHSIFSTSAYNHSQTVYILIGIACIISVSCTFAVTFVGDALTLHETNQRIVFILESAYGVMDFSIIILLIYLFLKPIFALLKLMSSTDIHLQESRTANNEIEIKHKTNITHC